MNASLPVAKDLEKLPMRAVLAYAARSARRCSSELRGAVADELLQNALAHIETTSTIEVIGDFNPVSLASVIRPIINAFASAPDDVKSREKSCAVFSLQTAGLG
jgi:hypothetical protein